MKSLSSKTGNLKLIKMLMFAAIISVAGAPHAFASDAAKKVVAETQNTPAAKAGKALSDCLLIEVDKAKRTNLSKEEFGKVLASACPEEAHKAREALAEALREKHPNTQWSVEDDRAVDFGVSVIRVRAYQIFTGVAKVKNSAK